MAIRKTQDEKLAAVDAKIAYHEKHLGQLKIQREAILNPPTPKARTRKTSMKAAMDAIKDAGLTPDEIVALAAKAKKEKAKE